MYEVEIKVRAAHDEVRSALAAADADRLDRTKQVDTYYDAPHRDFAETDEALRLRRETQSLDERGPDAPATTTKLTYKGPLIETESKTREEHETVVNDADAAAGVLNGLDFEPAATVEKEREFYEVDGYTITLDSIANLGEFVEVEAEVAESADVAEVRTGATELLRDLGLDPDEQIRTSYLGLLLDTDR